MTGEFDYKGEIFRVNAHGTPSHEEVFIMQLIDGEEFDEMSIDRMTEETTPRHRSNRFASISVKS